MCHANCVVDCILCKVNYNVGNVLCKLCCRLCVMQNKLCCRLYHANFYCALEVMQISYALNIIYKISYKIYSMQFRVKFSDIHIIFFQFSMINIYLIVGMRLQIFLQHLLIRKHVDVGYFIDGLLPISNCEV